MIFPCLTVDHLLLSQRPEAQGAWWFSRASNPLRVAERRPGWVRFPHASANKYKVNRKEGFLEASLQIRAGHSTCRERAIVYRSGYKAADGISSRSEPNRRVESKSVEGVCVTGRVLHGVAARNACAAYPANRVTGWTARL